MQTLEKEKDRQNTDPIIPEDTGTASPQPTGEKEQPPQQVPEQKESPNPPETSPQTPEAGQTEAASQAEQPEETASQPEEAASTQEPEQDQTSEEPLANAQPENPAPAEPPVTPETPPPEVETLDPIPEKMEALDSVYPEEEAVIAQLRQRKGIRPEWILGAIALLAAVVLGVTAVFCIPYFAARDEDPEDLPDYHMQAQSEATEEFLEPTESATEPENPTIPPERNPFDQYDFQYNRNNYLVLQNLKSSPGVDVSAHQGVIDWNAVKASGIEFAMIRLGYRGYGSGKLVEDEYAQANLEGATKAGLKIGAYFFSQALNIQEVEEEMTFMLNILGDYTLDMPIVLDWEIPASDARTANGMDARTLTDLQRHFCGNMKRKGYRPMVYFNWHQSETLYYLSELEDYEFWLALYQDRMTYPWRVEMWQYSDSGSVPGINGPVDLNVYLSAV